MARIGRTLKWAFRGVEETTRPDENADAVADGEFLRCFPAGRRFSLIVHMYLQVFVSLSAVRLPRFFFFFFVCCTHMSHVVHGSVIYNMQL